MHTDEVQVGFLNHIDMLHSDPKTPAYPMLVKHNVLLVSSSLHGLVRGLLNMAAMR